ncbi:DUF4235 domain-containing protein [Arthrobacter sp. ERGS1:01]|uniref:DUF4235 domain-containing protein n=1 Tax=Arthrobacter sp. ERGS1:01 TaxID=1704044 RepID=UPI0006B5468F
MKILIKLLGVGASLAVGAGARRALGAVWRKGTGNKPPNEATDLRNPMAGVLVFALVTAVSGAVTGSSPSGLGRRQR